MVLDNSPYVHTYIAEECVCWGIITESQNVTPSRLPGEGTAVLIAAVLPNTDCLRAGRLFSFICILLSIVIGRSAVVDIVSVVVAVGSEIMVVNSVVAFAWSVGSGWFVGGCSVRFSGCSCWFSESVDVLIGLVGDGFVVVEVGVAVVSEVVVCTVVVVVLVVGGGVVVVGC